MQLRYLVIVGAALAGLSLPGAATATPSVHAAMPAAERAPIQQVYWGVVCHRAWVWRRGYYGRMYRAPVRLCRRAWIR